MIFEKIERNLEIDISIKKLKDKIRKLENKKKFNIEYIHKKCKHEWVLDSLFFQYDDRPVKCKICNLVKY